MTEKTRVRLHEIVDELAVIRIKLEEYGEKIHKEAALFYLEKVTELKYELDDIGVDDASFSLVGAIIALETKVKELMND